jgi:hypothetical protein
MAADLQPADLQPAPPQSEEVVLAPRFGVPVGTLLLAGAALPLQMLWAPALWLSVALGLFGLFLGVQSALLRLAFTRDALLVRRQQTLLRCFPYSDWLAWKLFWTGVPVLFYFREQKSIHLLPVLFDAAALRQQLTTRLPQLSTSPDQP